MLDILAFEHLARVTEFDLGAMRTRTGDSRHLVAGEPALGEDLHDFTPDIPGRADHGNTITQITSPVSLGRRDSD
jgi:hypothetical protein